MYAEENASYTKENLQDLVAEKLREIINLLCEKEGLQGLTTGYIPTELADKTDRLMEYVADHIDEIMEMNRLRQKAPVLETPCEIQIFYDGIGADGCAFFNEICSIDRLEDLSATVDALRIKGYYNIAVGFTDQYFYLAAHTISEIECFIREDLGEMEKD